MMTGAPQNQSFAERMREAADLLESQGGNAFRVAAYRRAADAVAQCTRPIADILARDGLAGLDAISGIGPSLAGALAEMVRTGRWTRLERLRGAVSPEILFQTIPGIGPVLAAKIHDHLSIDSLEALEVAAHNERLAAVPGVGQRRAASIAAILATRLATRRTRPLEISGEEPDVGMLLDVDAEYCRRAAAGSLPLIAPRRFNPEGKAWLPILHTERQAWHFTALYSNTARSHELHQTRNWVIIYSEKDGAADGQYTAVTETRGALAGLRVIRGREPECRAFYTPLMAVSRKRAAALATGLRGDA